MSEQGANSRGGRAERGELDGERCAAAEQRGGFWVIQAPDLDAALELARHGAMACQGDVEVRPFQDE